MVKYLERMLMQAQEEKERRKELGKDDSSDIIGGVNIDAKTYCKLGHFHLLLEDYPKGLFTHYLRLY